MYYMLRFRGFMDPHWDVVVITSAKEDACVCYFYCDVGPYSARYNFECVVGINVLFCQDETHPGKTCIWAGITHRDT